MSTRLGILSIILAMSIFLIFELENFPVVNADLSNNNDDPDNSFKLKISLPFSSHIADKAINDKKHYIDNILPFP